MCCYGFIGLLALVIGFLAIIYLIYQIYSYIRCGCGKYGPFVSSYGKIKEDMLNEARKILKKSKKTLNVTDLGCGSGALLIPLAKEFPHHQFTGYEWDIVPLTMGKIKASGLKNITFIKGNYMEASYKNMDVIMCYVLKVTGEPLGKKLNKEIKPNAVVISEMFPLGHLKEVKQIQSSVYGVPEKIFVYEKNSTTKPAKKSEVKANSSAPKKTEVKTKVVTPKKVEKTTAKPVKKASAKNSVSSKTKTPAKTDKKVAVKTVKTKPATKK